jgi:GNAT superfamily N-acetyltransferase
MIRPAREADLPLLPAIEESAAAVFAEHGVDMAGGFYGVSNGDHWRPHLAEGLVWVVEHKGAPIAFLAAKTYGGALYIAEVDVRREQHRQGLGRALIETAEKEARRRGLSQIGLTTNSRVPWNAPYYARLGFHVEDPAPDWLEAILAAERGHGGEERCGMIKSLHE